jgi:hypothetical protein
LILLWVFKNPKAKDLLVGIRLLMLLYLCDFWQLTPILEFLQVIAMSVRQLREGS